MIMEVAIAGLVDNHAHLLRDAATVAFPVTREQVRRFHLRVAAAGSSPMDEPDPPLAAPDLVDSLRAGLATAAAAGLTEVTEMGMRSWAYLDALVAHAVLPARVRIYLASGLAADSSLAELDARRTDCGPWLRLDGVKFYADGWLGPRTCAVCRDFADTGESGILFTDPQLLAGRITPLAEQGWRIATHAIGDRAVEVVLDAYELVWGGDRGAMAASEPRIEHASVLSADLIARMAESGVVACIQPSFAVTDASLLEPALGPDRAGLAYPYTAMVAAGVRMIAGSDYPIEVLDPLVGLARLTAGRSLRSGSATDDSAAPQSRLPVATALALMSDPASGTTLVTADPREVAADQIDAIEVTGTRPSPFRS
jgi:predicted amidohydrolase YtcJ